VEEIRCKVVYAPESWLLHLPFDGSLAFYEGPQNGEMKRIFLYWTKYYWSGIKGFDQDLESTLASVHVLQLNKGIYDEMSALVAKTVPHELHFGRDDPPLTLDGRHHLYVSY
jgi:hypothetical protein